MEKNKIQPRKALNKAFLKVKPNRSDIDKFKFNLINLLDSVNEAESEEFHKNLVSDFLKNTYYSPHHFLNTKGRNDLVIHNGKDAKSSVGVILEAKKPTNKAEMLKVDNLNAKALQELLLYFLRDRIIDKNLELKHLAVTNLYEWFFFDAQAFEKYFIENKELVDKFTDFEAGRLTSKTTDFFYKQVAEPAINAIIGEISFTHFDIRDYEPYLRNNEQQDDSKLIALFKLLSPEHLLKLPFANDSNSLDKTFYSELLHIIGLTEIKEGSKKLIERKQEGQRHAGSLLENAIIQLDSLEKISTLENPYQFGETFQVQLFNIALELAITWIDRILFLKLLEAQLINYHQGDKSYTFLNSDKVHGYDDLNRLFFSVLARKQDERSASVSEIFANIPYLNSSLFEPTKLEHDTIFISNLRDEKLPIFPATVLKDSNGKKQTGELNALQYLFEFLNAYDFSSEGSEDIQEDNKTLINASVLGLIFEKINGYKDGSFFTPGFITMYMCRETIRRAVMQKFKEVKGWDCETIDQLYDKIEDKKEANDIINSLKICDPAVGSGHFLVSALNEIIAIKSELKILLDRQGKTLRDYHVEVVNDELIVTDDNGELFEYHPNNRESQRVQEALFQEKQTIIENCLFGVDINPNSVKICRLRLWIELLKNAYYKPSPPTPLPLGEGRREERELETLPNIDINIKCGNSLISRFTLDADLRTALSKSNCDIETYRQAVQTYRNAETKEQKREMERLIDNIKGNFRMTLFGTDSKKVKLRQLEGELYNTENQTLLFEETKAEKKAREKKIAKLNNEIDKLKAEIEDVESGRIYDNAFEWRFEFPEVLNDGGDFVGFDVVIGNPPYIRQEEIKELKPNLQQQYECYTGVADLFIYFYERGFKILKNQGNLTYISSNKYFRSGYGEKLRQFLEKNTAIHTLIDFGDAPVFEEAIAYPSIIIFNKVAVAQASSLPQHNQDADATVRVLTWEAGKPISEFVSVFNQESFMIQQKDLTSDGWRLESSTVLRLLDKLRNSGTPLGEYVNGRFYYGIKTGFNEAFVVDRETRNRLIAEHPSSEEVLKPFLRGRDVKRWVVNNPDLWLLFIPWHFPLHEDNTIVGTSVKAEEAFKKQYPAVYNHLCQFKEKLSARNKAETGIRYEWYALQRCAASYWQEFKTHKILYQEIATYQAFSWDISGAYSNNKTFLIPDSNLFLLCLLNSKLVWFFLNHITSKLSGGAFAMQTPYVSQIPIAKPTDTQDACITELVNKILEIKGNNPNADTTALEEEIDQLVYELYGLTKEEIKIVESKL